MNGAETIEKLEGAGFSSEEIQAWSLAQRQKLSDGGFSPMEIDDYFGIKPTDMEPIRQDFRASLDQIPQEQRQATSLLDALNAGWQNSLIGLLAREKVPDVVASEDASTLNRAAAGLTNVGLDLPFMALGGAMGAAGGGGVFSLATGAGGALALPEGTRYVLMDTYANGRHKTFGEFWELLSGAVTAEFKAWIVGASTGAAGGVVGQVARPLVLPAEISTLVTVGAALEKRIPDWKEFLDAAIVVGGLRASRFARGKLSNIYARVGKRPIEVISDAAEDPTISEDVKSINQEIPRAYQKEAPQPKPEVVEEIKPAAAESSPIVEKFVKRDVVSSYAKELAKTQEVTEPTETVVVAGKAISKTKGESPQQTLERMRSAIGEEKTASAESLTKSLMREASKAVKSLFKAGDVEASKQEILDQSTKSMGRVRSQYEADIEKLSEKVTQEIERGASFDEINKIAKAEIESIADRASNELSASIKAKTPEVSPEMENRVEKATKSFREKVLSHTLEIANKIEASALVENAAKISIRSGRSVSEELNNLLNQRALMLISSEKERKGSEEEQVLSRISVGGQDPKAGWSIHDFYTDWFDKLHPLNRAVRAMADAADISIVDDAYKLARLHVGVGAKANHFLEFGPIKFDTLEIVGKPLKEILKPVSGKKPTIDPDGKLSDLDMFRAYAVAKRAVELDARGTKIVKVKVGPGEYEEFEEPLVKTGIDIEAAKKTVARNRDKLEPVLKELQEYQTHVLDYLKDSQVISEDAYKAMLEANKDYIPFFREMEENPPSGAGKGLKTRSPIFRIKGSERSIMDPLESIIKNTYLDVTLADRNEIGRTFVEMIEETGRSEFGQKAKPKMRKIELDAREKKRLLKIYAEGKAEKLSDLDQGSLQDVLEEEFSIFRPNALRPSKNQIAVYREGKREVWNIDPKVMEAFEAGDAASARGLARFLRAQASLLRAGAIWTPEFIARNPLRDQLSAYIFSESGYKPFLDFARGVFSLARRDDLYQEWRRSGGPMAAMVSVDRQYLQKNVRELTGQMEWRERTRNVLRSPLDGLAALSEISEHATRLGEYKRIRKGGPQTKEAILEAGLASREVTLDFGRMGARGQAVNRYVAFFNAQLQGNDKLVRSFRDHPTRTLARIGAAITIPSLAMYLMNKDKKWYEDAAGWQRDLFVLVPIGGTEDRPRWVARYPKPFEVGVIFGTGAERIADWILSRDGKAFDRFLGTAYQQSTPMFLPPAATAIIETWSGRSIFRDRSLIPPSSEGMVPEYQYEPYTTELTKAIGKAIAKIPGMERNRLSSPLLIDNIIRAMSGGLGNHLLNLADYTLRKAGKLPDPVRPEDTLADTPFFKAFVMRYPSGDSQAIQDFFDGYREIQEDVRTIRGLANRGEYEAAQTEIQARAGGLTDVTQNYQALSNLSKLMRIISYHPEISAAEKRQLLDELQFTRIDIARNGNRKLEELRKIR